jgi:hypothetical protein
MGEWHQSALAASSQPAADRQQTTTKITKMFFVFDELRMRIEVALGFAGIQASIIIYFLKIFPNYQAP